MSLVVGKVEGRWTAVRYEANLKRFLAVEKPLAEEHFLWNLDTKNFMQRLQIAISCHFQRINQVIHLQTCGQKSTLECQTICEPVLSSFLEEGLGVG